MADNEVSAHIEQRIVMMFLVNEGIKSPEIHRRLQAQYGHDTLSRSKAFEWCKLSRDGRTSLQEDPCRGGSEPSVRVPESIEVVERLILKDRRITCLDINSAYSAINSAYYCQGLRDVRMALKQKRPGLITKGVLLLQDNARPHIVHLTTRTLQELRWKFLPHPPYSPDLAPSDFHLGPLKAFLGGRHFSCDDEAKNAIRSWLLHAALAKPDSSASSNGVLAHISQLFYQDGASLFEHICEGGTGG
ncbi:uncharacterized protein LOC135395909 [Ornithodoros turicata]|uniref:uncharacterized protein LOC135395909 n=1 Tax=Ornithodoros turicata TaxID=34597 RepID=UPI00313888A4